MHWLFTTIADTSGSTRPVECRSAAAQLRNPEMRVLSVRTVAGRLRTGDHHARLVIDAVLKKLAHKSQNLEIAKDHSCARKE